MITGTRLAFLWPRSLLINVAIDFNDSVDINAERSERRRLSQVKQPGTRAQSSSPGYQDKDIRDTHVEIRPVIIPTPPCQLSSCVYGCCSIGQNYQAMMQRRARERLRAALQDASHVRAQSISSRVAQMYGDH